MTDATRTAILDRLIEGPASGPSLAASLDISRAAVWKQVEQLRAGGVQIDVTGDGYHLRAIEGVTAATLSVGASFGWEVRHATRLRSTNTRGREVIDAGGPDCAIVADTQTAARGRRGRTWTAPEGGIWLSVVHTPTLGTHALPLYTLAAAVAVTDTLAELGVSSKIKWPNDILMSDTPAGKVAGILSEHHGELDGRSRLIIGVGVNLNIDLAALPRGATAVSAAIGSCDRRRSTQQLLAGLQEAISTLEGPDGTTSITARWRAAAATLGRDVAVDLPDGRLEGTAVDISDSGALVVETAGGRRRVTAGDCIHLR
jgi:BirA family biotin operon repressor/biotin-[acetyl-CoA-carboxylase] ligase